MVCLSRSLSSHRLLKNLRARTRGRGRGRRRGGDVLVETGRAEGVETGEGLDGSGEDIETHRTCQGGLEILHLFPEVGGEGELRRGGHGGRAGKGREGEEEGGRLFSTQQHKE